LVNYILAKWVKAVSDPVALNINAGGKMVPVEIISRFSRTVSLLILVWILFGGLPASSHAEIVYEIIDLGTLGGNFSRVGSINDAGQIVGEAAHNQGWVHATLFDATGASNNIDLGTLEGGGRSCALSISSAGQIVGTAFTSEGVERATLFDPTGAGNNINLGTLGGDWSRARSINNAGQIVGPADYGLGVWEYDACLFDMTGIGNNVDLGRLGGDWSVAYSINNTGQIVGKAQDSEGRSHATLFDTTGAGDNLDLGTLGGERSTALAINDSGRIVGLAENNSDDSRATLFDSTGAGNNIDLGTLGGDESGAVAVNDTGQIVGWAYNSQRNHRATLFDHTGAGNNIDLNNLIDPASGWTLISAHDINNSGWIVGNGFNPQGEYHAFLLVPINTRYSGGTGDTNDPYQIATSEDLMLLGDSPEDYDKHFILTADIDLDPNLPGNEILIDRPLIRFFAGTLDGKGHTISNMVSKCNSWERGKGYKSSALIGRLSLDGVIKNIQLQNITILGVGHYVGALLGSNRGLVYQCSVIGSITGESFVGGLVGSNQGNIVSCSALCNVELVPGGAVGCAGGLLGYNISGCIYNCYSIGIVTGTESVGGLIGENYYGYISNCYAKGTVTGEKDVGGLVGGNTGYVSNCYAIGTVTGDESVGGLIGFNRYSHTTVSQCYAVCEIIAGSNDSIGGLVGKGLGRCINSFWDTQVSGQTVSVGGTGLPTAELQDTVTYSITGWDLAGESSNGLADIWTIAEPNTYPQLTRLTDQYPITQLSGSGTTDDPYEIATAADLVAINDYDINSHYVLVADIDMSDMIWATSPIFFFNGTLDGQGHTISNLTIKGGSYLGLFAKIITHGVVTNLTIQDAAIIGHKNVGALAGESYGHITDCHVTGSVTGENYVAGLVGLAKIPYWTTLEEYISDCTADVVLSGDDHLHNIANAQFYD